MYLLVTVYIANSTKKLQKYSFSSQIEDAHTLNKLVKFQHKPSSFHFALLVNTYVGTTEDSWVRAEVVKPVSSQQCMKPMERSLCH